MSIPCPCGGGRAYSRDELIKLDMLSGHDEFAKGWEQILGPNDYYCPHEDDVLLPSEVAQAKRGWGMAP